MCVYCFCVCIYKLVYMHCVIVYVEIRGQYWMSFLVIVHVYHHQHHHLF